MTHHRTGGAPAGRRESRVRWAVVTVTGAALICAPPALADPAQPPEPPQAAPPAAAAPAPGTGPDTAPEPAAEASPAPQIWAVHGQTTFTEQAHPSFRSPYQGTNSLTSDAEGRETWDVTVYAGARPWSGGEFWINGEIDQGFGLDDTVGVAAFPSAEAYKVGNVHPYALLDRVFFRQTIDLGGPTATVDADENQLAGSQTQNRLVWTLGKFSVVDVFDTNKYAHDPRHDFLNWGIVDAATFDYAADSWGYSAGSALEWYQGRFTLRQGLFLLSNIPNSEHLDTRFKQFQMDWEVEERHQIFGHPGAVRVTTFLNRGYMGRYDDAVQLALETGGLPSTADVRHYASRQGWDVNLEQEVTRDLGAFARVGFADGHYEDFDFTDVDKTASAGLSLSGRGWKRPSDTIGLAGVLDGASQQLQQYLNAGGLGVLVGDGKLPHPGTEQILETYYSLSVVKWIQVSLDYQFIANPGYNRDRGPANVFALRLHGQF